MENVPHYQGYKNIPEGYYTKNVLNKEYGVKPYNENDIDATARVFLNSSWKYINLYHLDNCVEIKRRKVIEHELTLFNIAESLYIINKSAKMSRDTKRLNYEKGTHSVVQAAKTRQIKLYELKTEVLNKLIKSKKVDIEGFHTINDKNYLLVSFEGFTFHMPNENVNGLKNLGVIDELITAEKTRSTVLNFYEAMSVLQRFNES